MDPAVRTSSRKAHGGICADDDTRLSDARTPLAHRASHATGGSDPIPMSDFAVASANLTGQTAAVASVCAYTPAVLGTYRVGGYLTITALLLDVIQLRVSYTDETAASVTQTFFPQGFTSANLGATGAFCFPTVDIRSAASPITVLTVLTTGTGTITYDVGANIYRVG